MRQVLVKRILEVVITIILFSCQSNKKEINILQDSLNKAIKEKSANNNQGYNLLVKELKVVNNIKVTYRINEAPRIAGLLKEILKSRDDFYKEINSNINRKEFFILIKKYEDIHSQHSRDNLIEEPRGYLNTKVFYIENSEELKELSLGTLKLLALWDAEIIFSDNFHFIANKRRSRRCEFSPRKISALAINHKLYVAVDSNNLPLVKKLLFEGADINYKIAISDNYYLPILSFAIILNHRDIYKYLIEKGVDVNATDSENNPPLSIACNNGDMELVKLLIEKGAKADHPEAGVTPLMAAKQNNNFEIVKYLEVTLKVKSHKRFQEQN